MRNATIIFCLIFAAAALSGCIESGACVSQDEGRSYCFEDEDSDYCDGPEDTFYANDFCSDVGYPYYCTYDDMAASGADSAYYVSRYLNNASCDPYGSGGSSSGGQCTETGELCQSSSACCSGHCISDFAQDGYGLCADGCTSGSGCYSGCCAQTNSGDGVCSPSEYCN